MIYRGINAILAIDDLLEAVTGVGVEDYVDRDQAGEFVDLADRRLRAAIIAAQSRRATPVPDEQGGDDGSN